MPKRRNAKDETARAGELPVAPKLPVAPNESPDVSRRGFVKGAGKTIAVVAPLVLLFRPDPAYAAYSVS